MHDPQHLYSEAPTVRRRDHSLAGLVAPWLAAALLVVAGVSGCGDFSNKQLDLIFAPVDSPTPDVPATGIGSGDSDVDPSLIKLTLAPSPSLLIARYQTPFALQLSAPGAPDVCWEIEDGALPSGLALDKDTGLLFGKATALDGEQLHVTVRAYSPCDGARVAAGAATLTVVAPGACSGSPACAADEVCAPDGACRVNLGEQCPAPVGPGLVAELTGAGPGLHTFERVTVEAHGFSSDPSAPQRVLRVRSGDTERVLLYELPGGLELPVAVGDIIDLRVQMGPGEARYLLLRSEAGDQSFQLAAHDGPIDGSHLWASICGGLKHCPFLLGTDVALTAGCKGATGCSGTPFALRVKSASKVVLPGEQASWLLSNDGLPLYAALLADAATYEGCGEAVPDALTYVLLAGSRPHPVIEYVDPDVVLGSVPRHVVLSGARSMTAAPTGTIDKWLWSVAMPSGSPPPEVSEGPLLELPLYLVGDVDVRLAVQEGKPPQTSPPEAGKRLHVRPGSGLHAELVWDDPTVDLDIVIQPVGAPASDVLSEQARPAWASTGVQVVAQPDGAPLEVIRIATEALGAGALQISVAPQPTRTMPSARLRVWLNGVPVVDMVDLQLGSDGSLAVGDAVPVAVVDLP